jgi:molecular chaperone DnaK
MLRDTGDKLSATDRTAIESAIADAKKAIESNDAAGMTRAMDALTTAQHKAAESLYRQQQQGGASPGPEGEARSGPGTGTDSSSAPGGDVIDAEVVDEDKK